MIEVEISGNAEPFTGPLDLLLAIVRRNGYLLDRLPLGEITQQFCSYLQQSNDRILELGSDFFETASWLVLLKSRALLPRPAEGREASPEEDLRRALVAHERVQELGAFLGERLEQAGIGPGTWDESGSGNAMIIRSDTAKLPTIPTVQDALVSARRALATARMHADAQAAEIGMSLEEALSALAVRLATLTPGRALSTEAWLGATYTAENRSALLLALLELARLGEVWVFQPAPFAPLWIQRPAQTSRDSQAT